MKGYKAFDPDLKCRGFQYEVGKIYEMDEEISLCEVGFHFCKHLVDVYNYYPISDDTRICRVEALGKVEGDGSKYVTNKIKIGKEIKSKALKHANTDKTEVGFCNSGYHNVGNYNSGDLNTGNWNSGNCNSSSWNIGSWNSGNHNTGCHNSGDYNSGHYNTGCHNSGDHNSSDWNTGDWNTGCHNSGDYNSGHYNTGNHNTGYWNTGNWNVGDYNSGNYNSGDWNTGSRNSGDWNTGNLSSGVFNTDKIPKIKMFDKDSDWTMYDWKTSRAYDILNSCPHTFSKFVRACYMTDKEKEKHPEYKSIGGYVKTTVVTEKDRKKWYDKLPEKDKEVFRQLPNYDEEKFFKCIGIIKYEGTPGVIKYEELKEKEKNND